MSSTATDNQILIAEVRIRNFRSLVDVNVSLGPLTLLLGENNAGKTSFIEALHLALSPQEPSLSAKDMHLKVGEIVPDEERLILIDVLILPVDADGKRIDQFEDRWRDHFGDAVMDEVTAAGTFRQIVALRTACSYDEDRGEYVTRRAFLDRWPSADDLQDVNPLGIPIFPSDLEPISMQLLDAGRDLESQLEDLGSFWHHMVSNPELNPDTLLGLEQSLDELNKQIVSDSPVLSGLQTHLGMLSRTVAADENSVLVTPLPRHLRDISRGVDIQFKTKDAQSFPLLRHGLGTRGLASVLSFQAYMELRKVRAGTRAYHPLLGLEEPEAHLHPQAQRSIFKLIEQIPGQRIVSTHSPYVAAQAPLDSLLHFQKKANETSVSALEMSDWSEEDVFKIKRMVMNTRGELLFARTLLLFEGETEEYALPLFAEAHWRRSLYELGIYLVGVGGFGNYLPFLRLAHDFEIPWYILSDAEPDAVKAVKSAVKGIGYETTEETGRVRFLDQEKKYNFESYLVNEGYLETVARMIREHKDADYVDEFLEKRIRKAKKSLEENPNNQKLQKQLDEYEAWQKEPDKRSTLVAILSSNKIVYGRMLAKQILELPEPEKRIPPVLRELFALMSANLKL